MPPCKIDDTVRNKAEQQQLFGNNNAVNLHKGTQTYSQDPVAKESFEMAKDVVLYHIAQRPTNTSNKAAKAMRRASLEMLEKHSYKFNGMVNRLSIDERTGYETFNGVFNAMFSDHKVNWGRIVAMFAFSSRLAAYCVEHGMEHYSEDIATYLGQYISDELLQWIKDNGGWEEFAKQFPDKDDLDNRIWRGLLATAAVGLGALATIVAVK